MTVTVRHKNSHIYSRKISRGCQLTKRQFALEQLKSFVFAYFILKHEDRRILSDKRSVLKNMLHAVERFFGASDGVQMFY